MYWNQLCLYPWMLNITVLCKRIFLPHFHASGRTKYSLWLQFQVKVYMFVVPLTGTWNESQLKFMVAELPIKSLPCQLHVLLLYTTELWKRTINMMKGGYKYMHRSVGRQIILRGLYHRIGSVRTFLLVHVLWQVSPLPSLGLDTPYRL